MRRIIPLILMLAMVQTLSFATADQANRKWSEIKWPFLMDQWGEGRAFECSAAGCGVQLNLYVRAKIGFCSSTAGVADDNELERLSDFDFVKGPAVALGGGHEIGVAGMKGRLRSYATANNPNGYALAVALNNNSDALVATIVFNGGDPASVEPAIIEFLGGETIQRWLARVLGL
jgi:hypothetical protein